MNSKALFFRKFGQCAIAVLLLAQGCSWLPRSSDYAVFTRNMPASGVFSQSVSLVQEILITEENGGQRFISQTEFTPFGISMVALTGFGQKLFELQYSTNELTVKRTPFLPKSLSPERVFSDMQMIYWPLSALRDAFPDSNIRVQDIPATPAKRIFESDEGLLIEISYQPEMAVDSTVSYTNLHAHYTMEITTISKSLLDS